MTERYSPQEVPDLVIMDIVPTFEGGGVTPNWEFGKDGKARMASG
jgi:hypothetical protein